MAFYARNKDIITEVLEFATEEERDKWIRFEDDFSYSARDIARAILSERISLNQKAAMYLIDKYTMKKSNYGKPFGYTLYYHSPYCINHEFKNKNKDYVGTFMTVFKADNQTNNEIMKSLDDSDDFITSFECDGELLVAIPDTVYVPDFILDLGDIIFPAKYEVFDCYISDSGVEKREYR